MTLKVIMRNPETSWDAKIEPFMLTYWLRGKLKMSLVTSPHPMTDRLAGLTLLSRAKEERISRNSSLNLLNVRRVGERIQASSNLS